MHRQALDDPSVQLDFDRVIDVLAEATWAVAAHWLQRAVAPRGCSGCIADRAQSHGHAFDIGIVYQQIDIAHRALAGGVQSELVQGRAFERGHADPRTARRRVDLTKELADPLPSEERMAHLVRQERLPADWSAPAHEARENCRYALQRCRSLGETPFKVGPLGSAVRWPPELAREDFRSCAQGRGEYPEGRQGGGGSKHV